MQAFHRGYAGPPGLIRSRRVGRTTAGVQAVIESVTRALPLFPEEPTAEMEVAFHNGVPPGARGNFLNG